MAKPKIKALRVVLGDQLDPDISSLEDLDPKKDRVLMMEVLDEASYVPHHPKKLVFVISAMRHFAKELMTSGVSVDYISLEDNASKDSFSNTLESYLKTHTVDSICVTEAGEHRVVEMLSSWEARFGRPVEIREDNRFVATHSEFRDWSERKKQLLMENFYRLMRRKTGLLMDGDKPVGGKWNFDKENRKPLKGQSVSVSPLKFAPDEVTRSVIDLIGTRYADNFGDVEPFWFAVTRSDANKALEHFLQECLPFFGDFQDAMSNQEDFLFHSVLSHYINIGLLNPLEVCKRAVEEYQRDAAPLNAVEGFVRQIIGWREYVRGIYWLNMPGYESINYFNNTRSLPAMYWGADTKMNCVANVVRQTKEHAYAHHIQRLMVTGNFAMLLGVKPDEIHEWYLSVYADAYEWVEMPNTLGMATFSDGGIVGTKPYAASGAYINKMSDYCSGCSYQVKEKLGEKACPFNYLYWNFLMENENKLKKNHRMSLIYRQLAKMTSENRKKIKQESADFIASLGIDNG